MSYQHLSSPHRLLLMNQSQASIVTYFVLLGFPGPWKIQITLFSLILLVYMITLTRNMAIICAVRWNHQLHTPMYMFLANFSFLEIWYVNCTVPTCWSTFFPKLRLCPSLAALLSSTSSFPWAQQNVSSSVPWRTIGI